ncbi:ACP phosphodiesterase [Aidingimonas halophila]|uniref:Acyl carrier protein phosphodiesterase n=1 Tax=Aidingimonas halophila TaxID=574349 RepID=A0A1H3BI69_9GAMM|nr:ACP phosphodiesterase [Aidingimonas halophila]GHC26540.1 ACP phosphodiesterase [Aidingimonas halophila]SDX41418.1 Acyl carrier protein phosphodiesterase [Aidingimonas halophila]
MNFLAHAWLSQAGNDDFLYGNLIADGVKGADLSAWPDDIARGIKHHRHVDAHVDAHSQVRTARQRAPSGQRRYAGIALDLLWDHFLARQEVGSRRHQELTARCYQLLESRSAPMRLARMVPLMVDQDWLTAYADFDFTCRAIAGLGQRLSGPNHLARLTTWLDDDYFGLEKDFNIMWPDLVSCLGTISAFDQP